MSAAKDVQGTFWGRVSPVVVLVAEREWGNRAGPNMQLSNRNKPEKPVSRLFSTVFNSGGFGGLDFLNS